MKTINSKIVNAPYDDVFRTLLNDRSRLIIPVNAIVEMSRLYFPRKFIS